VIPAFTAGPKLLLKIGFGGKGFTLWTGKITHNDKFIEFVKESQLHRCPDIDKFHHFPHIEVRERRAAAAGLAKANPLLLAYCGLY
jgi:hypothetical protein